MKFFIFIAALINILSLVIGARNIDCGHIMCVKNGKSMEKCCIKKTDKNKGSCIKEGGHCPDGFKKQRRRNFK